MSIDQREHIRPDELREMLRHAHLPTLIVAMATLSGDHCGEGGWLREQWRPKPQRGAEEDPAGGLDPQVAQEIRDRAADLVLAWRAGELVAAPPPGPEALREMLEFSLGPGNPLPPGIGSLLAEELGVAPRDPRLTNQPPPDFHVVVVGGGFAGLCAGIKLTQLGIAFTILDKNADVGGTWLENTYPGCGVDTPSHLYSFSFAQRATWSRFFARREELYDYLNELADDFGLRPHVRLGHDVRSATWDDSTQTWTIEATAGGRRRRFTANAVITATGYLNRPSYPDIPGLDTFAGPCMHTARWQPDVRISGKRVAVLGTGASAMQLVPAIAGDAQRVTVFQRSAQWGLPNANQAREVPGALRWLMREVPFYLGWYRLRLVWNFGDRLFPALQIDRNWPHQDRSINKINDRHREFLTGYIRTELGERADELMPVCLPTYPPYGKRPLLDAGWFRTVRRDDVEVVTSPVREVREHAVVTEDGREIEADVLVLATGFQNLNLITPMEVYGRSGRSLRDTWGPDDAAAHLGITVHDFPNFFMLMGPNTIAGHGGSAALGIEMQVGYVMKLLARMIDEGIASVECRASVQEEYMKRIDGALAQTIWTHPGMTTYYRNSAGRVVSTMPWTNTEFREMTCDPDLEDFELHRAVPARAQS